MNGPLVSICIPAYNGAEFIRETVMSAASQDFRDIEIIVSDDGSSDGTAEIVSEIPDDRIILIRNEKNLGFPGNWNSCIAKARGKYIKLVCQDDLLAPDCVGIQAGILEKNSNVSLVTGASQVIGSSGKVIMTRALYKKDTVKNGREFARMTLKAARNRYGEPASAMYRREDLGETRYDGKTGYCVDWDMAMTMSYKGDVYYCAKPAAKFRVSSGSISSEMHRNQKKKIKQESLFLFDKHNKAGGFGFGRAQRLIFSVMTDLYSAARGIVLKMR